MNKRRYKRTTASERFLSPLLNNARNVKNNIAPIAPTIINEEQRIRKGPNIRISIIKKGEMSPASQHTSGKNPSRIKAIPVY